MPTAARAFEIFRQLFSRRSIWTVALYRLESEEKILHTVDKTPERFFGASGLRLGCGYPSTTADPFLFVNSGRLYIFFEVKTDFQKGEIWAQSMGADGQWVDHGLVLAEKFHLSYPNVFTGTDGCIYMLPETAASGKVWLYKAEEFPMTWRRERVLLDKPLSDPSIIIQEGAVLLLGTTRTDELMVHHASSLGAEFTTEGVLVTRNKAVSRNGGMPFTASGKQYRPAQNCERFYGESLGILEIESVSPTHYKESLVTAELYPIRPKWMELGYHHMSVAKFGGHYFVAIDGRGWDRYLNTLLLAWFRILGK